MATANESYDFPSEHKDFLEAFQSLLKKYPRAAVRFALADLGENATVKAGGPSTVWECRRTEWGILCTRQHPQ